MSINYCEMIHQKIVLHGTCNFYVNLGLFQNETKLKIFDQISLKSCLYLFPIFSCSLLNILHVGSCLLIPLDRASIKSPMSSILLLPVVKSPAASCLPHHRHLAGWSLPPTWPPGPLPTLLAAPSHTPLLVSSHFPWLLNIGYPQLGPGASFTFFLCSLPWRPHAVLALNAIYLLTTLQFPPAACTPSWVPRWVPDHLPAQNFYSYASQLNMSKT